MQLLVKRALDHAAVWHRSQLRKYPRGDVPYISHSAGVAVILGRHLFDDEIVAAGVLHDVMEDCGVSYDSLLGLFGQRVADLVRAVTEADKTLSWETRKREYLDQLSRSPWDAQAIAIADKLDNFESIAVCSREHGNPWAMFRRGRGAQVAYFEEFLRIAENRAPHPLVDELREAFREIKDIPDDENQGRTAGKEG